jgi:excisionase family DNA binding protein
MLERTENCRLLSARWARKGGVVNTVPELLTVDEVAALLRTSRKAVYAMIERRQLPGVRRIGRRVLVSRIELLHWLDHNCASSPKG